MGAFGRRLARVFATMMLAGALSLSPSLTSGDRWRVCMYRTGARVPDRTVITMPAPCLAQGMPMWEWM
jgi:hypothetical protein